MAFRRWLPIDGSPSMDQTTQCCICLPIAACRYVPAPQCTLVKRALKLPPLCLRRCGSLWDSTRPTRQPRSRCGRWIATKGSRTLVHDCCVAHRARPHLQVGQAVNSGGFVHRLCQSAHTPSLSVLAFIQAPPFLYRRSAFSKIGGRLTCNSCTFTHAPLTYLTNPLERPTPSFD